MSLAVDDNSFEIRVEGAQTGKPPMSLSIDRPSAPWPTYWTSPLCLKLSVTPASIEQGPPESEVALRKAIIHANGTCPALLLALLLSLSYRLDFDSCS